jgi:hypothetical protein
MSVRLTRRGDLMRGPRLTGAVLATLASSPIPIAHAQPGFVTSGTPVMLSFAMPVQGRTTDAVIDVARMIFAEPKAETPLAIQVGPVDALPRSSFLRIRGLPSMAALSEGHSIAPGAWAVPLVALPTLKINVPAAAATRNDVVLTLVTVDGVVLAEARTTLVIASASTIGGAQPKEQAAPPATIATINPAPTLAPPVAPQAAPPSAPTISAEEKARAQRYLTLGQQKLSDGDISAAQLFFQRAADAGLAEGAFALAGTFDPIELERLGARSMQPDIAKARRWYERAAVLGAGAAAARLQRLGSR